MRGVSVELSAISGQPRRRTQRSFLEKAAKPLFRQSQPPVNWWYAQPLEGAITDLAPERGTESLTPHYHYGQPLQAAVFLCLLILVTRERVEIFFHAYLIRRSVLLKLVADIFCNYLFISSYCIHIISSAPKIPRPILVFQICMSVKYHQATLSLEESHELCCTQVRRYAIMYNKLRKLKTA